MCAEKELARRKAVRSAEKIVDQGLGPLSKVALAQAYEL
jgi:hypothetical protein